MSEPQGIRAEHRYREALERIIREDHEHGPGWFAEMAQEAIDDWPPKTTGWSATEFTVIEARLRRYRWKLVTPGGDGLGAWKHGARGLGLIHSVALEQDGQVWEHISISRKDGQMPGWEQVRDIFHEVAGPDALGIIVVPPKQEHVNIAEVAHVWRCLTRRPIPDFTRGLGTI